MLDAISDFWKPMKKNQAQEALQPEKLQVGSSIGFGFVPQASLSGQRLQVSSINTYQFGEETLTSFVLSGKDSAVNVSMIIAEAEGEHYLAISRKLSISDRIKLFDGKDLENVTDKSDVTTLTCKETPAEFKGWLVSAYRREIQGLKGRITAGDSRKGALEAKPQEFKYTLLVSESNEQAIEIEQYDDGRIEAYATVYRRISDIGEVTHPADRPSLKLATSQPETAAAPAPVKAPEIPAAAAAPAKPEPKPEALQLQELPKPAAPAPAETKPVAFVPPIKSQPLFKPTSKPEEKPTMSMSETATNGAAAALSPKFGSTAPQTYPKQETRPMSKTNGMEQDAIECDLRIANRIIDEAIRSEMRLSDVVRRIIELPVANQELVQIPVTLAEDDFSLLAIRYGIPATDKNAIRARIAEDLNEFSAGGKKTA